MRDFTDDLKDLRRRLGEAEGYLKISVARARLTELEFEISRPDLWDDQDEAKKINTEFSNVKSDVDTFDRLSQQLEDAEVLHEMARELDDESQEADIQAVDLSISHQVPTQDPYGAIVHGANQGNVMLTMVGGEVLYDREGAEHLDHRAILERADALRTVLHG